MFLLDTHVWLWSVEHDRRLGGRALRLLNRAAAAGSVRISPVSLFEISSLHVSGRLHLSAPLGQWINDALEQVRVADISKIAAVDAGHIPRAALADPMDRLLVATARELDATLVTADRAILAYARDGHVRVHDATR